MSGSRWMLTLGSPGVCSRVKITASDSLASTKTPRKANLRFLEHDPEKWEPVFRKDHAQTKISQDTTPASASTVCINTLAPAVQSACVASSSSLWLTPSLQGTNTIAAGMRVLRLQAS